MAATSSFDLPPASVFTAEEIRQKKFTKRGLSLNMLLVGENGTGKRTFVNTLSNKVIFDALERNHDYKCYDFAATGYNLTIQTHTIKIIEPQATPITLNVSFTENFGFNLQNSTNAQDLVDFIEHEYHEVLQEEIKIQRKTSVVDNRVHVVLYFIKPTGKELNEFDITNMKELGKRTNLIPIISKADTLTESEVKLNKSLILNSVLEHKIEIFDFLVPYEFQGEIHDADDEEDFLYVKSLNQLVPFTIIGSNSFVGVGDRLRLNSFGVIDIDNVNNCDFKVLRNVLLGSHIQEFKEITIAKKYEDYRIQQLVKNNEEEVVEENKSATADKKN